MSSMSLSPGLFECPPPRLTWPQTSDLSFSKSQAFVARAAGELNQAVVSSQGKRFGTSVIFSTGRWSDQGDSLTVLSWQTFAVVTWRRFLLGGARWGPDARLCASTAWWVAKLWTELCLGLAPLRDYGWEMQGWESMGKIFRLEADVKRGKLQWCNTS